MPPTLAEIRTLYHKALFDAKAVKQLEKDLESLTSKENAILYGYKGMSKMLQARNSYNPYSKMSYFKEGKNMLEEAISTLPLNAELRLLRFSIQTNAPFFLGYNNEIEKDKKILIQFLKNEENRSDKDLYKEVRDILLASKACSDEEKETIRSLK